MGVSLVGVFQGLCAVLVALEGRNGVGDDGV